MKTLLSEFRPDELQTHITHKPLILVPIGAIEWHAAHLSVGVDGLLSLAICRELAEKTGCLVAPPVWFGVCRDLDSRAGYFGTIATISENTLESLVADLLNGLAVLGFKMALLVSGHFELEHFGAIERGMNKATAIQSRFITELDLVEDHVEEQDSLDVTWPYAGDHAAEFETSLMLHYFPDLVDMSLAPETVELTMEGLPAYLHRRYPRRATTEYGEKLRAVMIDEGVRLIDELLLACSP